MGSTNLGNDLDPDDQDQITDVDEGISFSSIDVSDVKHPDLLNEIDLATKELVSTIG